MSEIAMNIWNQVAPSWIYHMRQRPEGALAREYLLLPSLLELIGGVEGRRVLDAGCGEGFISRLLAQRGASVTGVDVSTLLLEEARRQEEQQPLGIVYLHGSVADLHDLRGFDTVVSSLVLPIVPDYKEAIRAAARALRMGGDFVAALTHPAFDGVGAGWVQRPSGDVRWSTNRYMAEVEGRAAHGAPTYHRPLNHYMNTAFEAGFALTGLREPVPSEEYSRQLSPQEREFDLMPALIMLRFEKIKESDETETFVTAESTPVANVETTGDKSYSPASGAKAKSGGARPATTSGTTGRPRDTGARKD